MEVRKKTLFSFFLAAAALTAGCGLNQSSRFRMAFLPPASHVSGPAIELDEPPVIEPNLYLKDVPPFLLTDPQFSSRRTRADSLVERANRRFEAGKRYYQSNDIGNARREFDAAIDSMLDASDQNPTDRAEYERKLDAMVDAIHRLDLTGLGASAAVEEGQFEKAPLEDILQMTFPVDPKLKDKVREQVAATVSQLPLAVNDAVLGYIHFFSSRGHKTLVGGLQRSGRYRPMIQRILDEEGLPQELIHVAQAESGFIPRALSRKAAGGMWQFLKWRGNGTACSRPATPTTAWILKRLRAPPPAICATCTRSSATGTWRLRRIIADRWWWKELSNARAMPISGKSGAAERYRWRPPTTFPSSSP